MSDNKDQIRSILTERRKELGYTMKEVATLVGVSEATISRWESGDIANMRRDRIAKLAQALKISPAVIMGWDEQPAAPVYSAAAGKGRLNDGYPSEEYPMHLEADEFLFRVSGRSMEPTLHDNDMVIIIATNVVEDSDQIALVQINGDEATLKHVQAVDDGIMLVAENYSVYPPKHFTAKQVEELPVRILGVAKTIIRDL